MDDRPGRNPTERELRALSTDEFLRLIEQDLRELDRLIAARQPPVTDDPPHPPFHTVICCQHRLGDFMAATLVCCPFCGTWHRASDFPLAN
jgi:hypothetical protein